MQYAFLIYGNEAEYAKATPEEQQASFAGHGRFNGEVHQKGIYKGGAPLDPVSTATTVRLQNGKPVLTDGPFAETKEQLAGFYLLDCKDLDEAKIPMGSGCIEVRPVMHIPGM